MTAQATREREFLERPEPRIDGARIVTAVEVGEAEEVRALLREDPLLVHARGDNGWTLLHHAAAAGREEAARLLILNGADEMAREREHGATPLHLAAGGGQLEVVRLLLLTGVDVNALDEAYELSPLGWSVSREACHTDVAHCLIAAGARLDLFSAVALGREEPVRVALKAQPERVNERMNARNDRRQPLHLAVLKGHLGMARLLLRHGADVQGRTASGQTPLGLAVEQANAEVLDLIQAKTYELDVSAAMAARLVQQFSPICYPDLNAALPAVWAYLTSWRRR